MGKFCLYADAFPDAPCFSIKMRKYSYLDTFIAGKSKNNGAEIPHSVPVKVECITLNSAQEKPEIINEKCMNCLFCVFGCTGNRILINSKIHPYEMCKDISNEELERFRDKYIHGYFEGSIKKIEEVPYSSVRPRYKSFEKFTGVDETSNIAIWAANAMKYLSTSNDPRVAIEVGVKILQRQRGGRLDVSLLNLQDNYLFVAETKISFKKMMDEGRYESQMLAYETELKSLCPSNIHRCKFLLIGGIESDMLPSNHTDHTGLPQKVDLFYEVLKKQNLFFMSANAMHGLGVLKLFNSIRRFSLENLYTVMTNGDYYGLLSCGLIRKRDLAIIPLSSVVE